MYLQGSILGKISGKLEIRTDYQGDESGNP